MPNRVFAERVKYDPRVAAAERACRGAREFFFLLLLTVDDYGRFTASPKALNGALYPVELVEIRHTDIARRLAACAVAGLLSVHEDPTGPWLQLGADACYDRASSKQPKFGPRLPAPPSQEEFPLLYSVAGKGGGGEKKRGRGRPDSSGVECGVESEASAEAECGEDEPPTARGDTGPTPDSKTRATGRERPQTAAPGPETKDEAWETLGRWLGFGEMSANYAMWKARLGLSRSALLLALEDGKNCARTVQNRAAYLTERYIAHGGISVANDNDERRTA